MRHTIVSALLSAVVLSPLAGASPIGNVPEERGIIWDSAQNKGSSGNAIFDSAPAAATFVINRRDATVDDATKSAKKTRTRASRPAATVPAAAPTAPAAGAPPAVAPGATGTLGAPAGTITWGAIKERQEDDETLGQPETGTTIEGEEPAPSNDGEAVIDTKQAFTNDKKPPPKWNNNSPGKPVSGKKPQSARPDPNPGPLPQNPNEAQGTSYTPNTPPQPAAPEPLPSLPQIAPQPIPQVVPQPAQQAAPVPVPAAPQASQGGSPVIYSPDGSAALQLSDSSLTFFPSSGGTTDTVHSGQNTNAGSGTISNQISKRSIIDSPKPGVVQGLNIAGSALTFYPSKGGSTTVTTGSSHPHAKRDWVLDEPAPGVSQGLNIAGSSTTFYPANADSSSTQWSKRDEVSQELAIESSTLTFFPSEGGSETVTAKGSGLQWGKREEKFVA